MTGKGLAGSGEDLLRRTFDIRPGEFRRVTLMGINIFLIITTLMIIKPVINALFLSYIGVRSLPSLFVLVAIVAGLVSLAYARALSRIHLQRIILYTYRISIPVLLVTGLLLHLNIARGSFVYFLYIGEVIFGLLTTSQFWILANLVFNPLEAKRLFGLVGAGAIAGGVTGGYLTSVLAPLLSTPALLAVAAGFLAVGYVINREIWREYIPADKAGSTAVPAGQPHTHPYRLIRQSRHLTLLASIVGISIIVAKLIEYQYSALASAAIRDPDRLAAFFGFWFSTFNIVSLGIQIFITRRVVGLYGVGRALFVLPLALFGGAVLVLITPVLWAGILLKGLDISIKQSVHKAAIELMILPVPLAIKTQAKTFIDVFVDSAATGLGGLLLIFLINGFDLPLWTVSLLVIGLIGLWIRLAMNLRKEYLLTFRKNLQTGSGKGKRSRHAPKAEDILNGMRRVLENGPERQLLYVLGRIEEGSVRELDDLVPRHLSDASPAVRVAALRALHAYPDPEIVARVRPLLRDPSGEVRAQAFMTILRHSRKNRVEIIRETLTDADPMINGAALVGLATEARNNPEMQRLFEIESLVSDKLNYLPMIRDEVERQLYKKMILRAIGQGRLSSCYSHFDRFVDDPDPEIRKTAIAAMGASGDLRLLPLLLNSLLVRETRDIALRALAAYGPAIVPELERLLTSRETPPELLRFLPQVAEGLEPEIATEFLMERVRTGPAGVRTTALQSLDRLKKLHPDIRLDPKMILRHIISEIHLYRDTLGMLTFQKQQTGDGSPELVRIRQDLTQLLERRLEGTLDRIFHLLGLRFPPTEFAPVQDSLKSDEPQKRFTAVELLDNLLEPDLKRQLTPILENALLDSRPDADTSKLEITVPNEVDCLTRLCQLRDEKLQLATLQLIIITRDRRMRSQVSGLLQAADPRVARAAGEALQAMA